MLITFVTWDAPNSPYLRSLYLPMLAAIARADPSHRFQVLQFIWGDKDAHVPNQRAATEHGIGYESVRIVRPSRPEGVLASILIGARRLTQHARDSDVVLARSVLPAAATMLAKQLGLRSSFCFDADGSMPDERLEFGGWSEKSASYRAVRWLQNQALERADSVVTRTSKSRTLFEANLGKPLTRPVIVVPNGRSPDAFRPASPEERKEVRKRFSVPEDALWIVALGAVGPQYLPEETCRLFERIRARNEKAVMHWFTPDREALVEALGSRSLPEGVRSVALKPEDVGPVLGSADIGLALRAVTPSQKAVSPVKVAEFLLSGLAVVASPVGDLAQQLQGVTAVRTLNEEQVMDESLIRWLASQSDEEVRAKSRSESVALALRYFSLEQMCEGYRQGLHVALTQRRH